MIVELDGRIVGYARVEWTDQNDGEPDVRPDLHRRSAVRGRGIGSALLAWGEERARRSRRNTPVDCPQLARRRHCWDGDDRGDAPPRGATAMSRSGRSSSWSARRSTHRAGRRARRASRSGRSTGTSSAAVFDADGKAFRDHWGSVDDDEASFERFAGDPRTDPSLFVVAFAGEEVAGAVLNVIDDEENAMFDRRRGLLDSVFIRRP